MCVCIYGVSLHCCSIYVANSQAQRLLACFKMLKTARRIESCRQANTHGGQFLVPEVLEARKKVAQEYRMFLLGKYSRSEMTGCDVAIHAWYHAETGIPGLEDLALNPSHASKHGEEHVRLVAARTIEDPKLMYVEAPIDCKFSGLRKNARIPMRVMHKELSDAQRDGKRKKNRSKFVKTDPKPCSVQK